MKAWICLGSNLEEPFKQLEKALKYLKEKCYLTVIQEGKAIQTKPFGYTEQPDFANQLLLIDTPLSAYELLTFLKNTECVLGRKPGQKWGPRLIDMDIIFYEDEVIKSDILIIPHPGVLEREYLLSMLNDVIPEYIHPEKKEKIATIYNIFQKTGGLR